MKKTTTLLLALLIAITAFSQSGDDEKKEKRDARKGTHYGLSFDLGLNNYLMDGKSPDDTDEDFAAKPWGSWNFAINSVNRTHLGGPAYLQWGGGVSWYNFRFQDETMRVVKTSDGIDFVNDTRLDIDPVKSKLTATYLNVAVLPVLRFGSDRHRDWDWDDDDWDWPGCNKSSGFRIGLGGYAGYKIGSLAKFVYEDEGNKRKEKDRDSYYLNTWRYGARLQLGFRDIDFYVNYDLNELFVEGKGPQLNAFSFGITI